MLLNTLLPAYYFIVLSLTPVEIRNFNIEIINTGPTHAYVSRGASHHTIYYNPDYAIRVHPRNCQKKSGLCIVRPEDLLLHEILHVIHHNKNEIQIQLLEQKFYRQLTAYDGIVRPKRDYITPKPVSYKKYSDNIKRLDYERR